MHDLIEKNSSRFEYVMRAIDVLALYAAGETASLLRFSLPLNETAPIHTVLLLFCCAVAFVIFSQFDLYQSWRGRSLLQLFVQTALAITVVLVAGVLFSFLIRQIESLSRLWMTYWYVLSLAGMMLARLTVYALLSSLRERGFNNKHVIIVGYGETGRELHRRAHSQIWTGYQVKAIHAGSGNLSIADDIERLENLQQIPAAVTRHAIHEIWLTLPLAESAQLQAVQYLLRNVLVDIRWAPDTSAMGILSNKTVDFLGMPVVELNSPASSGIHGIAKEIFDKVFALIALVLLWPLMLTLAILIKFSSRGPVLFRQPRLGLNGRRFSIYKFRSMKLHTEAAETVTQATRDDPRITSIGRFMRRTSLDELPQFINVLKGEMSVVGPRPHALPHNDLYKDKLAFYMLRHRVKPGITGWAQIHGCRGETDSDEKMARRIAFDLQYIRHWSFWMDLKIIVWTAFKGWTNTNAY
jgi:putative colanic acid biosynthesis UDP-glucose lipid carrier transferase